MKLNFLTKDMFIERTSICLNDIFPSWRDRRPAHGDLQPGGSSRGLHDRWLHDVAQSLHHWNVVPFPSGQSTHMKQKQQNKNTTQNII